MGYVGQAPNAAVLSADDITDGIIANADIASDAAISMSKTTLSGGTGLTLSTNTLNVDAAQTQITSVGTIATGTWQGTAIASGYIAGDAITGAKIADDAIDSEHYAAGSVDTAHIADNQITLAKMAGGTDGQIITYDASGDPVAVGPGNDGQILTSTGAGSPPAFEDAASSGASQALATTLGMIFNF